MAGRYDKYEPKAGGFRAPLASDTDAEDTPVGVGLNSSGQVVPGAGNTGVIGVLGLTKNKRAGDIVDVMTSGEIVEFDVEGGATEGTVYFADDTDGELSDTGGEDAIGVGYTVEASRLVVRLAKGSGGGGGSGLDVPQLHNLVVATADAEDPPTAEALANALKTNFNALIGLLESAGILEED